MARSQLLTIAQAAARLGIAPSTLRRQAHDGRIAAIRPGHDYLVESEEVDRYGREQRRGQGSGAAGTNGADPDGPPQMSGILRANPKARNERDFASDSLDGSPEAFLRAVEAGTVEAPTGRAIAAVAKRLKSGKSRATSKADMSGISRADSGPQFGESRPAPKPGKR